METLVLHMTFINEMGKKRTISVEDPPETLSETEVKNAMDAIISADIFEEKLVAKDSAKFVTQVVEDIIVN